MFFNKSTTKDTTRRSKSNNAELKELRIKARRRLIGALALVLAAFIIVPLLFDDPKPEPDNPPLVVPAAPGSLPANSANNTFEQNFNSLESDPIAANGASGQISDSLAEDLGIDDMVDSSADLIETSKPEPDTTSQKVDETVEKVNQTTKPEPEKTTEKPEKKADPAKQPAKQPDQRTDDGSVALALLSGKTPEQTSQQSTAQSKGNYYLQVAAYTTEKDANTRRDGLLKSGVSNAYVESGQSNGQTVYRLRVGPFSSQQAAQAAQTRLRALGYPNGLISAK